MSPTSGNQKIFVIKHFNRQNKTVISIFGHMVVRIHGRSRDFLRLSPVSCKDRQKIPWFLLPGFQWEAATLEAF